MINLSVCPWQAGPILTSKFRKMFHDPVKITGPYLSAGMTVMDIGCGFGFFTIPMSDIVGKHGKVVAVDLQQGMLNGLDKNIADKGNDNITAQLCEYNTLRIQQWNGAIEFALIFYMLHEVRDKERFIQEIYDVLAPSGKVLFSEPFLHVSRNNFQKSLGIFYRIGFEAIDTPDIPVSRAVILQKKS